MFFITSLTEFMSATCGSRERSLAGLGIAIPIIMIVSASAAGRAHRLLRFCSGRKERRGPADDDEQFRPVGRRGIFHSGDACLMRIIAFIRAEAEAMGYAKTTLIIMPWERFLMISIGMTAFITA